MCVLVWSEPGTFVKKNRVVLFFVSLIHSLTSGKKGGFGENTPFNRGAQKRTPLFFLRRPAAADYTTAPRATAGRPTLDARSVFCAS